MVTNVVFASTNVRHQLCGKREGLAQQTGDALPQGIVEALKVIGLPCFLGDRLVPFRRDDPGLLARLGGGSQWRGVVAGGVLEGSGGWARMKSGFVFPIFPAGEGRIAKGDLEGTPLTFPNTLQVRHCCVVGIKMP